MCLARLNDPHLLRFTAGPCYCASGFTCPFSASNVSVLVLIGLNGLLSVSCLACRLGAGGKRCAALLGGSASPSQPQPCECPGGSAVRYCHAPGRSTSSSPPPPEPHTVASSSTCSASDSQAPNGLWRRPAFGPAPSFWLGWLCHCLPHGFPPIPPACFQSACPHTPARPVAAAAPAASKGARRRERRRERQEQPPAPLTPSPPSPLLRQLPPGVLVSPVPLSMTAIDSLRGAFLSASPTLAAFPGVVQAYQLPDESGMFFFHSDMANPQTRAQVADEQGTTWTRPLVAS